MNILQVVVNGGDTLQAAGEAAPTEEKLSFLSLAMEGGLAMIPLVILSIIGVYLLIERYTTIRKASKIDANFMNSIRDLVSNGNIQGAKSLCERTDSPIARILLKGISRIGKPLKNIEVSIENVGKLEVYKLEKGLPTLATISGAAPMIGFLGTVLGMIKAFYRLANSGGSMDITLLSGGIYEAMVTTVAGLVVGIFAYISYNSLTAMIDKVINKMEASSVEFIDLLQEPAGK